jgi:hypothetical protein
MPRHVPSSCHVESFMRLRHEEAIQTALDMVFQGHSDRLVEYLTSTIQRTLAEYLVAILARSRTMTRLGRWLPARNARILTL